MDSDEKLEALNSSKICEHSWLAGRGTGMDYVFRFNNGVEVSSSDKDKAIELAYAYFMEREELSALRLFTGHVLQETNELIEARKYKPLDNLDPNTYIDTRIFVRFFHHALKYLKQE
jgi:hypothetical protein